jgi:hypothetical protein
MENYSTTGQPDNRTKINVKLFDNRTTGQPDKNKWKIIRQPDNRTTGQPDKNRCEIIRQPDKNAYIYTNIMAGVAGWRAGKKI